MNATCGRSRWTPCRDRMVQLVGALIRIFFAKKTILGGGSLRIADDNEALNPCRVQEEPVGECGGLHCNQALGEVNLTFENNYDFCHQPHLSLMVNVFVNFFLEPFKFKTSFIWIFAGLHCGPHLRLPSRHEASQRQGCLPSGRVLECASGGRQGQEQEHPVHTRAVQSSRQSLQGKK